MFKVGGYAIPKGKKEIKIIDEFEEIDGVYIVYMTDGTSYNIKQLNTLKEVAVMEGFEV